MIREKIETERYTLYLADCKDVEITESKCDVIITDPPYGVGFGYEGFVDDDKGWISVKETITDLVQKYPAAVCMSFSRLWEMPPAKWAACWFKPGSVRRSKIGGWSTWEPVLLYGCGWKIANDMIRLPDCVNHTPEAKGHPCPKPLNLFTWLIDGTKKETIFDPFMGSGTTGVACMKLGRKFVGVEICEKYFRIAAKRIAKAVELPLLFDIAEKEEQRTLFEVPSA